MSIQEELKQAVRAALSDAACVIGWGPGPDALRATPLFMRGEEDADALHAGFLSVSNPALYLPEYKGSKTAVVAKGCDARSVMQLVSENLVKREEVVIIGYGCKGVIDVDKVAAKLAEVCEPGEVTALREEGEDVVLITPKGEVRLPKSGITADKCSRCRFPNALDADVFVGEKAHAPADEDDYADLTAFEALPMEERQAFWEKEMSRCIRCYACRNACPLCVCRDHCVATSREPHWVSQADGVRDKLFFQVIHASHLAGRCTGCGECERACPMGIPVLLFKRALSRRVERLFAYRAGVDEGTPPLLAFTLDEPTIKERDW